MSESGNAEATEARRQRDVAHQVAWAESKRRMRMADINTEAAG